MRIRAVAVVIDSEEVLLIHRRKEGREYGALPGGGVEQGETLEEACLRELREETSLEGVITRLLPVPIDLETPAFYLAVTVSSRGLRLGDPGKSRSSLRNVYTPAWVALSDLDERSLSPEAWTAIRFVAARPR